MKRREERGENQALRIFALCFLIMKNHLFVNIVIIFLFNLCGNNASVVELDQLSYRWGKSGENLMVLKFPSGYLFLRGTCIS